MIEGNMYIYSERKIAHKQAITQDTLNDKAVKLLSVSQANTNQQLDKFCQQDPKCNVHWLQ
jgi:hypothetical protein